MLSLGYANCNHSARRIVHLDVGNSDKLCRDQHDTAGQISKSRTRNEQTFRKGGYMLCYSSSSRMARGGAARCAYIVTFAMPFIPAQ